MGHVTDYAHLGDTLSSWGQYFTCPTSSQNLKSLALAIPSIF